MNNQDRFLAGEVFTMDYIAYKLVILFGHRYIHAADIIVGWHYVANVSSITDQGIHWNTHILGTLLQGFTRFDKFIFPALSEAKGGAAQ